MKLPPHLPENALERVPNRPGVYHFIDRDNTLLYVGKSVNLKQRIQSHFRNPAQSSKSEKLFYYTATINTHHTAGDIGAQLLELAHIKNQQPIYNKRSRAKKMLSVALLRTDGDGYQYPYISRVSGFSSVNLSSVLGVFRSNKQAKNIISNIAKEYTLCPRRLQISTKTRSGPCFYRQLGQCRGACTKDESPESFNARLQEAFSKMQVKRWPFDGTLTLKEEDGDRQDTFTVDHWHLTDAQTIINGTQQSFFDDNNRLLGTFNYDAYKILSKAILKQHPSLRNK